MPYEINVSFNGTHYFATAERSLTDKIKAYDVHADLCLRFPSSEGFKVTASYSERSGHECSWGEVLPDNKIRFVLPCWATLALVSRDTSLLTQREIDLFSDFHRNLEARGYSSKPVDFDGIEKKCASALYPHEEAFCDLVTFTKPSL